MTNKKMLAEMRLMLKEFRLSIVSATCIHSDVVPSIHSYKSDSAGNKWVTVRKFCFTCERKLGLPVEIRGTFNTDNTLKPLCRACHKYSWKVVDRFDGFTYYCELCPEHALKML